MGTNGTFANSGNIVLTHEINNNTMQLAVDYLPKIVSAYKQVLDVATCYNITYPYFENIQWTNTLNGTSASNNSASSSGSTASSSTSSKIGSAAASSSGSSIVPSLGLAAVLMFTALF